MARIVPNYRYNSRALTRIDLGRALLLAMQYAIVGGIGLFIVLAVVNSLLGAPDAQPAYNPYEAS
jgi:hypothetical protein